MKKILATLLIIIIANISYAADTKITELTEDATPGTDSLIMTVDDPSGTPASRKSSIAQILIDGNIPDTITIDNATASATATLATTVTITDNESTAENNPIVFVEGGDLDGGNLGLESDGTCYYTPSTGVITATGFVGALTGNVTGDVSGSSGSTTGNAATVTNGVYTTDFPLNQNTTGNAATSTALAANGANCSAGSYPLGVDASGATESCTDATTEINAVVNALGGTNLTCALQSCDVDDAFLVNNANDSTTGVLTSTGFTIGSAAIVEAELEMIDGITAGTAAASKALVLDASSDIATINSLTATTLVGALTGNASTASALAANGGNCAAGSYPLGVDASGVVESCTVASTGTGDLLADGTVPLTADWDVGAFDITAVEFKGALIGNASTSTALAADPANCSAGEIALGVTAAGVAECTATPSGLTSVGATTFTGALTGNASTATALASNPTDCSAGEYATTIAANGDLTCAALTTESTTAGRSLTLSTYSVEADAELYTESKAFVLETPTDDDSFIFWKVPLAITITDIDCIVGAATSAIIDIQECASDGTTCATVDAAITCDTDGAADDGTFSNGGIDAGDWLLIDVGTVTGTVGYVAVTITYTKND